MANEKAPILCADDNHFDIALFLEAFREIELPHRVDVVRDGQEALDYLSGQGAYLHQPPVVPAAILLDIKMPKLNGIEVLKILRNRPDLQHVPIIMVTASEMVKDVEICYDLGANAYVVKPIDFDEFVHMMRSLSRFWALLNSYPQ